jgi:DNA modification methylase
MKVSWSNLENVYHSDKLNRSIEVLEKKYNTVDESHYFSALVNTSLSKKQPYHRWVKYREGYAGELVKELLLRYPLKHNEIVMDPMCGSGSTLVACNELNIESIGLDVNPYAVLSSRVKGVKLDCSSIDKYNKVAKRIVTKAKALNIEPNKFDLDAKKYFNENNFSQLIAIKEAIKSICQEEMYEFFYFALLAKIEECSNRKKDGNGLATRESKVQDCYEVFEAQVQIMLYDLTNHPYPNISSSIAILDSATELSNIDDAIKGKVIGSIIFSPPYANSFDYFESYKLEIIFGEWALSSNLKKMRENLIRNFRKSYGKELKSPIEIIELLCSEIWFQIPQKELRSGVRDGRTRLVPNMIRAYFEDMENVIKKCLHRLSRGSLIHIVVDQSAYVGVPIPTDLIFAFIANKLGYEVVEIIKCRKANTSAQQLKQFPYLKDLLRESIVIIRNK